MLSETAMKRALARAVEQRKPVLYEHKKLGKCWITERAFSVYLQHMPPHVDVTDVEVVKRDIAINAYRAWETQLRYQDIGQQELILSDFRLHFAVDEQGRVFVDCEPWFAYE
jgi:hypothetical protein